MKKRTSHRGGFLLTKMPAALLDLCSYGSKNIFSIVFTTSASRVPHPPVCISARGTTRQCAWSPFLFFLYVNDLPNNIDFSSTFLFADDTKLMKSPGCFNDSFSLQEDIDSLQSWCSKWKLSFNINKCSYMHAFNFCLVSSDSTPNYNIGNLILTLVPHHRDLGVTIESNLTFSVHDTI